MTSDIILCNLVLLSKLLGMKTISPKIVCIHQNKMGLEVLSMLIMIYRTTRPGHRTLERLDQFVMLWK